MGWVATLGGLGGVGRGWCALMGRGSCYLSVLLLLTFCIASLVAVSLVTVDVGIVGGSNGVTISRTVL